MPQGLNMEERFSQILKRDSFAKREIAKKYRILINIRQGKNPSLRYTPKEGNGVLYVAIDNTTFLPTLKMATISVSAFDVFGISNGDAPVYEWEVKGD